MTAFLLGVTIGVLAGVPLGAGFVVRRHMRADEAEIDQAMAAPDVPGAIKATFAVYDQATDDRVLCVRCPELADTLTADGVPVCVAHIAAETGGGSR